MILSYSVLFCVMEEPFFVFKQCSTKSRWQMDSTQLQLVLIVWKQICVRPIWVLVESVCGCIPPEVWMVKSHQYQEIKSSGWDAYHCGGSISGFSLRTLNSTPATSWNLSRLFTWTGNIWTFSHHLVFSPTCFRLISIFTRLSMNVLLTICFVTAQTMSLSVSPPTTSKLFFNFFLWGPVGRLIKGLTGVSPDSQHYIRHKNLDKVYWPTKRAIKDRNSWQTLRCIITT